MGYEKYILILIINVSFAKCAMYFLLIFNISLYRNILGILVINSN